jgi:NTE family protein
MADANPDSRPQIALVLQGGGALGAYHIGAYQALAEADMHPDWVTGISIGAINAAVIAGNPPEDRVAQLDAMWQAISWPDFFTPPFLLFDTMHNWISNTGALLFGQPNFFTPRGQSPLLASNCPANELSFYDTSPMLETLARFANFERINSGNVRLSLGSTNIETGQLEFFDSKYVTIEPHHALASGSLPPGFPATRIGDNYYWDGGCVSNTPLDVILDEPDHPHLLVFMIDLWDASGPPPGDLGAATWRAKQIQYASRTAHHIDAVATKTNLLHAIRLLKQAGSSEVDAVPDEYLLSTDRLDIVHIVYHPGPDQIPNSDAEFSRSSIAERRQAGYDDMSAALAAMPWKHKEVPAHLGALVHRVRAGDCETLPEPNLRSTSDARQRTVIRTQAGGVLPAPSFTPA